MFKVLLFLTLVAIARANDDSIRRDEYIAKLEHELEVLRHRVAELESKLTMNCSEHIDNVACATTCRYSCLGMPGSGECEQECYDACASKTPKFPRNTVNSGNSVLGSFLSIGGIQHVGLTVQNLTRSTEFFVKMLGAVVVPGAGGPGWQGDDVMQLLEQRELLDADERGMSLQSEKVAMLNSTDTLSAVYLSFGNVFLELLEYSARDNMAERSWMPAHNNVTAPSIVNNMHVSFQLNADVDVNAFIETFETQCAKHAFDEVRCNRIVPVSSEAERRVIGKLLKYNSYVDDDPTSPFRGWTLAYCKGVGSGPDSIGVQIEFNVVIDRAKQDFYAGLANYLQTHQ
jgi:hypothetical protein